MQTKQGSQTANAAQSELNVPAVPDAPMTDEMVAAFLTHLAAGLAELAAEEDAPRETP